PLAAGPVAGTGRTPAGRGRRGAHHRPGSHPSGGGAVTVDRDALYLLLPALYRQRDEERGGPLRQLLEVLTDELAVVGDGVDQLYDDLFVETAAPWVLPYLAELIGLRGLPAGSGTGLSSRAEVANTIAYRRRKGTAAVLEQVARDVTGWPSRAVEFFELIAAT